MPQRARITRSTGSDHEDFTAAVAAVSDSDHDDADAGPGPGPGPGPNALETNYIPQEPGPHATDDELREVRT